MNGKRHAVVIVNLGGPSNLDEVRPFLKQLFQDPDIFKFPFGRIGQNIFSSLIATLRAPKSRSYYAPIGNGSPIHANTLMQADKLQAFLQPHGDFTVLVAQRYWHPFISEVVEDVRLGHYDVITLLPLFPHYSTTTTLSLINEWRRQADGLPEPRIIERFYQEEGYLKTCVKKIQSVLERFDIKPHILFSAHSLPVKRILAGDPYEKEVTDNMELIMDRIGRDYTYSLCYQSKIGPIKWLSPSFESAVNDLVEKDMRHILVFPISFVSEHVETLYELDIQKRDYAIDRGILQYERVDTVQDDDEFIRALRKLVLETVS
ncbi:MAG: ferrochelatase [Candidatus Marinimicrobia bacterium]|nr:ferrochelatase [Candidatus Neomarinimicrobiota bacterium]